MWVMRFPSEDTHPGFNRLKTLAAKVGRSFYDPGAHEKARTALYTYMATLPYGQLPYYAHLVMLVRPTVRAGATGEGAFWAVASRVVNEIAQELLDRHRQAWRAQYGDAMFVVVD